MRNVSLAILLSLALSSGCGQTAKTGANNNATGGGGGGGGGGGTPAGTPGTLEVLVGDAPFAFSCFSEATIVIDRIDVQPEGATGDSGFVQLSSTPQAVNLIGLSGGVTTSVAAGILPAARYNHVRVFVSKGILTWTDGFQKVFVRGVEITRSIDATVPAGGHAQITLDFDLPHTFGQNPPITTDCTELKQAGKLYFSPSMISFNDRYQGVVHGIVSDKATGDGFGGVVVSGITPDGSASYSTFTSDGTNGAQRGEYDLALAPGSWNMVFEAPGRQAMAAQITVATATAQRLDVPMQ